VVVLVGLGGGRSPSSAGRHLFTVDPTVVMVPHREPWLWWHFFQGHPACDVLGYCAPMATSERDVRKEPYKGSSHSSECVRPGEQPESAVADQRIQVQAGRSTGPPGLVVAGFGWLSVAGFQARRLLGCDLLARARRLIVSVFLLDRVALAQNG